MNKTIPTLFGIVALNLSNAQSNHTSRADSLRNEGLLQQAIEAYALAFREDPSDQVNTYDYACALALDQQIDSAFHYLEIATKHDSSVRALTDPDFYYLLNDARWTAFEHALVKKVEAKHGTYARPELSKELWRMKIRDQAFYYHIDIAEKTVGRDSPLYKALWELKHELNADNLAKLEEIIAEHGWPRQSVVKGSAAQAVFLVVQHAGIETQRKYLPMMTEAANEGEAGWSSLALLIDRVNLREGKPQVYGSQIYRNEDGSFYVKDLREPEYVNQRRKEVGLEPIEDYVSRWGIEWTIEQKEKPGN